jgi:hypothetical protein
MLTDEILRRPTAPQNETEEESLNLGFFIFWVIMVTSQVTFFPQNAKQACRYQMTNLLDSSLRSE